MRFGRGFIMSNTNVVSYRRVSTQDQVINGEGLPIQLDSIMKFCAEHGYIHAADFVDEGVSGAKEAVNRTGLLDLLEYCKDKGNEVTFVIVDKLDRLSREPYEQLFIEKELMACGIHVLFASQEGLNSEKPEAEMLRLMMMAFAKYERSLINQRLTAGKHKKCSKGNKPFGRQPFGYMFDESGYGTVVNEAEAELVRRIYDLRITGKTYAQIADYLNAHVTDAQRKLFCPANRSRKWNKQSVMLVLSNEYYIGRILHQGNKIMGNHEPIVDAATWDKANSNLNWRGSKAA